MPRTNQPEAPARAPGSVSVADEFSGCLRPLMSSGAARLGSSKRRPIDQVGTDGLHCLLAHSATHFQRAPLRHNLLSYSIQHDFRRIVKV